MADYCTPNGTAILLNVDLDVVASFDVGALA
jgi:hypothetical protein